MASVSDVGIVVPTIGGRPEYLPQTLSSIRAAGDAYVLMVGREDFDPTEFLRLGLIDDYVNETATSLPRKINQGFNSLPPSVEYINWIGDDDLLAKDAITIARNRIKQEDKPALVFGGCQYIGPHNELLWLNKSGQWAVPLLRFGPQLIPQPGALYRRSTFNQIGQLSENYSLAFDFDMFLKLSKAGKAAYIPKTLASFRWHQGSLSVSRRQLSVKEASRVRRAHLPAILKPVSWMWEWAVLLSTYLAGKRVSKRIDY